MDKKQCQECGETFSPRKKTSRFCNNDCYEQNRRLSSTTCAYELCQKDFQPKSHKSKFCSQSCAASANNLLTPKRKPEGFCKNCGEPAPKRASFCDDCKSGPLPENRTRLNLTLEGSAALPARKGKSDPRVCIIVYGTCVVCKSPFINHSGDGKNKGRLKTCLEHRGQRTSSAHRMAAQHKKQEKITSWLSGKWDGAQPCGDLSQTIWNYLRNTANNICQSPNCISDGKPIPTHPLDGRTVLEVNHINGNGMDHRPKNLEVICPTCHALTLNYRARNMGNGRPVSYIRKRK